MKPFFVFIFILSFSQKCYATNEAWYYIYVKTEYVQGPWIRTDVLNQSGGYFYLEARPFMESFGSEVVDLATAIFQHVQKETESPESYRFKYLLSVINDTVIIQTEDSILHLPDIKDELIASFTLNSFRALKIIQPGKSELFFLKDISLPYMDLVLRPAANGVHKQPSQQVDSVAAARSEPAPPGAEITKHPGISPWLWFSAVLNMVLLVLLARERRSKQSMSKEAD